jgi:SAM-dependent methyltransferase
MSWDPRALARRIRRKLSWFWDPMERRSGLAYWETRAAIFGGRAVFNAGHAPETLDGVTASQRELLLPLLKQQLRGGERLVLDFGCGIGRFTADLARAINGRAVGVDPVGQLIDQAPRDELTEYHLIRDGIILLDDASVDVVWICLVLGGITAPAELNRTRREIARVLKPGGLVFLVENTNNSKSTRHWAYREVNEYKRLFDFVALEHICDYQDVGETVSVMAGR